MKKLIFMKIFLVPCLAFCVALSLMADPLHNCVPKQKENVF